MQALSRDEYEILGVGEGEDRTVGVFILWFPAGNQKSNAELSDTAYFKAVDSQEGCDAMRMARAKTRRVVVPLLLVNVIIKSVGVKGRCIRMRSLEEIESGDIGRASSSTPPPDALPVPVSSNEVRDEPMKPAQPRRHAESPDELAPTTSADASELMGPG